MRALHLAPITLALCVVSTFAHDDDPKILLQVAPIRPQLGQGWIPGAAIGQPGHGQASMFDASGVTLSSWLTPGDLGVSSLCNDNWGYVSPSGREYAVQCTEESTVFVEVTDPASPVVVGAIAGPVGLWRDAKIYQEYAYSVSETNGVGVQVIDLTQIDAGTVTLVNTVEGTDTGKTHNVAINEESGYLYRTGGSYHGLRIYSLADPANPSYVASWDARYVHDAQIVNWSDGRELAFCCSGFNGGWDDTGLTIVDVTDKQNITVVAQRYYAGGEYSHQGWLSEDRQYFYLGDELDEDGAIFTRTHVFDVSNPDATTYVGAFENGSRSIGHNMYTRDGKLFQANYRSGLRVFDLDQSPTSPPEVAYFDTQPGNDTADFGGTWSVYPYLPSGTILLSDRAEGLFLLRLEGDCDGDGIPDSEEADCNANGTPDDCESFSDCNSNGIPDECEPDCDGDGLPDACEADCNANGTPDDCESFSDCNSNGIPDECEPDCDGDGLPDACEADCNANGTPDDCESFSDCNSNGVPDECEPDCDGDGLPDACEADCNANGTPDDCESFSDCNSNGVPDECEPDCDGDGLPDDCEADCNANGTPDDCESFSDCNSNGIPDECEPDCDGDGLPDDCEADCNANGTPDDCESFSDCNSNGIPDECEPDCDGDGLPDDCETDCNANGTPDDCESISDCNSNGIPDECEPDCDGDGLPDACETDCNANGTPDDCESFSDCNSNGIPDECEPDCDGDGLPDACETDCNANGTPDDCETFDDCNSNGIPDECEPDSDGDGTIDACELGVNYCGPAVPNSSGLPGVMDASGSKVVGDNDLTLVGKQLAPNQFGYFLVSDTQGFVANPGGSQGNLCLGGTIGRYMKDVASTGATGSLSLLIDLDKLPAPLNIGVNPGETWNFQAWFRDQNPDQTSNFTDGLEVTFL